jgi:hypothetical protein
MNTRVGERFQQEVERMHQKTNGKKLSARYVVKFEAINNSHILVRLPCKMRMRKQWPPSRCLSMNGVRGGKIRILKKTSTGLSPQ